MADSVQQDLSARLPGQSLMELLADGSTLTDSRNAHAGLKGETETALELGLLGPDYKVVHSIPVPEERRDLDHIVIGPTGVFVINSKNHIGKSILVDDEYLIYNQRRYQEPSDSARDARRAAERLALKKTIPVVAVWGATKITIKSAGIASVCSTQELVELILDSPKVLSPEQVAEIYKRVITPATWGINAASLRDPKTVAEKFARVHRGAAPFQRSIPLSKAPIDYRHNRSNRQQAQTRVRTKPGQALGVFMAVMLSIWGVGSIISPSKLVVPVSPATTETTQASAEPTAIKVEPQSSVSNTPMVVAGGSRDGSTLEAVRSAIFLYLCDGRRLAVATPVGETIDGETLFFVPPGKITTCVSSTVYHYRHAGYVSQWDTVRGLLKVRLLEPKAGYSVGAVPKPGTHKFALTTNTDIQLVKTQVRETNGVLMADVSGADPTFVPGSPLFNEKGKLVGILDDGGVVLTTKGLTRG